MAAGESEAWRVSIEIPALPPSKLGGCAVIDVEYMISVIIYNDSHSLSLRVYLVRCNGC